MSKEVFGLREKIRNATNEQEVVKLLKTGNSYEFASEKTKTSWKNTAFKTLQRFKDSNPENKSEEEPKTKKVKGKKVKS